MRAVQLCLLLIAALSLSVKGSAARLVDSILDPGNEVEYEKSTAKRVRDGVFSFHGFGVEYRVDTRRLKSSLFEKGFRHFYIHHEGHHVGTHEEDIGCVYEGDFEEKSSKGVRLVFGTINLCQGYFSGHVMTKDYRHTSFTSLGDEDDEWESRPILVYNSETLNELEHYNFGVVRPLDADLDLLKLENLPRVRSRRLASSRIKYIQLLIVNDFEQYKKFVDKTQAEAANAIQYTSFLYNKLNSRYRTLYGSDAYSFSLSISGMITFSHGNPWRNVLKRNDKEVDTTQLLELFNEWRENQLSGRQFPAHSAAHLITGEDLSGNTVGLAYLQRICSNSAATGINQGKEFNHVTLGTIVAHELAHNLGVFHTGEPPPTGLTMKSCKGGIMGPSGVTEDDWTDCTVEYLKAFFDGAPRYPRIYDTTTVPACLEKRPTFVWGVEAQCGNGLKEAGEQCDCGSDDCSKIDPCCDGTKCTFKSTDYECSSTEPCCTDACKIYDPLVIGEQRVCREKSSSSCDIEEVCDGQTSQCPPDKFQPAGTACTAVDQSRGTCFAGTCLSHSSQCFEYKVYGATGPCTKFGSTSGDAGCGDLYCQIGSNGCQRILKGSNFVKVHDGTKCNSQGHVCDVSNEQCVPPDQVSLPHKITCSNGVLDEGETDVDCGGPDCYPCFPGESCLKHEDCVFGEAGTEYACKDSTYTTNKNLSGTVPTEFERPTNGKCSDFLEEQDCAKWSGCIWIGEYSSIQINKCKNTGWYPNRNGDLNFDTPAACRNQRKMESCINWLFCDWNWDTNSCEEVDRNIVYGKCIGSELFGRGVDSWFDKVIAWVSENKILAIGVAIFAGVLFLSCSCSCIARFNHRAALLERDKVYKSRQQRNRQSPVVQNRPASVPEQHVSVSTISPLTSSGQNSAVAPVIVEPVGVVNHQPDLSSVQAHTVVTSSTNRKIEGAPVSSQSKQTTESNHQRKSPVVRPTVVGAGNKSTTFSETSQKIDQGGISLSRDVRKKQVASSPVGKENAETMSNAAANTTSTSPVTAEPRVDGTSSGQTAQPTKQTDGAQAGENSVKSPEKTLSLSSSGSGSSQMSSGRRNSRLTYL